LRAARFLYKKLDSFPLIYARQSVTAAHVSDTRQQKHYFTLKHSTSSSISSFAHTQLMAAAAAAAAGNDLVSALWPDYWRAQRRKVQPFGRAR
jgi:hypothetical protein